MANEPEGPDPGVANPAGATGAKDELDRLMWSISGQIHYLSTGDRAGLRRIYLTQAHSADGTVVKLLTAAKVPAASYKRDFDRWRLVAHFAATLSGTGALKSHDRNQHLGRALQAADVSENRLLRLLAVRGDALDDQLRRAARVLAQHGKRQVDLRTVFHLLGDGRDAEEARLRVARDSYAAEAAEANEGKA